MEVLQLWADAPEQLVLKQVPDLCAHSLIIWPINLAFSAYFSYVYVYFNVYA